MTISEPLSEYQKDKIDLYLHAEEFMNKHNPPWEEWGIPQMIKLWYKIKELDNTP